jgi:hypothetical protein
VWTNVEVIPLVQIRYENMTIRLTLGIRPKLCGLQIYRYPPFTGFEINSIKSRSSATRVLVRGFFLSAWPACSA